MSFNPFLSRAVANKAVALAKNAMQNEAVRKQIRDAPDTVTRWAKAQQSGDGPAAGALANLARLDPTARFGQLALERRLDALEANTAMVFDGDDNPALLETSRAVREIRRAIIVAAPLPLLKRKKVFMRIDGEINVLEQALIDAVLPASEPGVPDPGGEE